MGRSHRRLYHSAFLQDFFLDNFDCFSGYIMAGLFQNAVSIVSRSWSSLSVAYSNWNLFTGA